MLHPAWGSEISAVINSAVWPRKISFPSASARSYSRLHTGSPCGNRSRAPFSHLSETRPTKDGGKSFIGLRQSTSGIGPYPTALIKQL